MIKTILKSILIILSTLSIGYGGLALLLATSTDIDLKFIIAGTVALLLGVAILSLVSSPGTRFYKVVITFLPIASLALYFWFLSLPTKHIKGNPFIILIGPPVILLIDIFVIRFLKKRMVKNS